MMKNILLLLFIFTTGTIFSQLDIRNTNTEAPCYQKEADRMKKTYFEYDCGKIAGVVDCNEKLEYEEQSNTFYLSNSGARFTGQCETCHRNGLLERRITFVNGREDGKDTTYYKSGCPMVIREHTIGLETGTWRFYYDSTQQVAWIRNYFRGIKEGVHVFFDNLGDTTVIEHYSNDLLNGVKKVYFTKNKIERITTYKDGVFNGPYTTFNLEGKKTSEMNYKMGQKDGVLTYYYDDGTLMRTENWSNGIKNGQFTVLYYNGSLQSIENYKKGIKEGLFEERYNTQKLKRRVIYKKGELIEEHRFDIEGNETYTFGAQPYSGKEDDDLPTVQKGKKDKKKKKKKGK